MAGQSPHLGRGAITIPFDGISSSSPNQRQEVLQENPSRLRWRIQNRSTSDTLSIWSGSLGSEVLIAVLQPGLKTDAGDVAQSSGTLDRISVSSSGASCPYFCQEVV
jgi:hypothetical protein